MGCVVDGYLNTDQACHPIYRLSLHDALPIYHRERPRWGVRSPRARLKSGSEIRVCPGFLKLGSVSGFKNRGQTDRKSTLMNSSHSQISYVVFCLKKNKAISSVKVLLTIFILL